MKIKEGDKLPDSKVFIIDIDKEYVHQEISTNGGTRTKQFWEELAELSKQTK